jgi:hypothetical protein
MEDFIKQNQSLFNSEEPNEEHFERFKNRLEKKQAKQKIIMPQKTFSIAAVIAFLLFSAILANLIYKNVHQDNVKMDFELANSDFFEIQNYYQLNFKKELIELEQLNCQNSDLNKNEIFKELQKFEQNQKELENELMQNNKNEIIINAMIMNMQERSDFLNNILNKVKENC